MLEVTFYRDERERLSGFSARGHAEFAQHGQDIVCAAVSAILQAARLGLTEFARADVAAEQRSGRLEVRWSQQDRDSESIAAIIATAELAIDQIGRRYPKHVRLKRVTDLADRRRADHV